jgi:hypothetical protein
MAMDRNARGMAMFRYLIIVSEVVVFKVKSQNLKSKIIKKIIKNKKRLLQH